jgi:preprotein translocase subunit SecF
VELFRSVNVDWLGKKWYFLAFSLIFSVSGVVSMGWHWTHPVGGLRSPVPLGVDFRGGTEVEVQFQQSPDIGVIRQAMDASGIKDATVQRYDETRPALNAVLISLPEQHNETELETGQKQVLDALQAHYPNPIVPAGTKVDVVGPTVGHQLERQALLATLYSLLGMLVYLWFRFQLIYGVAAVVAVFHDTLITVDQPDGDRGHSHPGGLFDERHHRGL